MIQAKRYHDISTGHRVVGHENKCKYLHGHNYRFHFTVEAEELDQVGRVLDFGVIKEKLAKWIENHYDHKFLVWAKDPLLNQLQEVSPESIYIVDFNPTAENIAKDFVLNIAPGQLKGTGCKLVKLEIEETRKCSAVYEISS